MKAWRIPFEGWLPVYAETRNQARMLWLTDVQLWDGPDYIDIRMVRFPEFDRFAALSPRPMVDWLTDNPEAAALADELSDTWERELDRVSA